MAYKSQYYVFKPIFFFVIDNKSFELCLASYDKLLLYSDSFLMKILNIKIPQFAFFFNIIFLSVQQDSRPKIDL